MNTQTDLNVLPNKHYIQVQQCTFFKVKNKIICGWNDMCKTSAHLKKNLLNLTCFLFFFFYYTKTKNGILAHNQPKFIFEPPIKSCIKFPFVFSYMFLTMLFLRAQFSRENKRKPWSPFAIWPFVIFIQSVSYTWHDCSWRSVLTTYD